MPYFTYDTSVIISKRVQSLPKQTGHFLLSSIVLMELMASATDDSQRKMYEQLRGYQREKLLIVPNEGDWLLASKVLYWLSQSRRRSSGGKLRRLERSASQRMALDALLAVSARRYETTVVTENWKDFKLIQRFCNVKVIKSAEFFK